jgi:anti-sigma factor RsiW
MIDYDSQLKLQAYLDGELPEAEARQVAQLLAQDQDAVLLLAELRNTRQAVAGSQTVVVHPESREFFWSKIEREIRRQENVQASPAPKTSWLSAWRRFLVPAGAVAGVALVLLLTVVSPGGRHMETALADSGAFTYRDYNSGATLVWLSYPAENEFADGEPAGTVQ